MLCTCMRALFIVEHMMLLPMVCFIPFTVNALCHALYICTFFYLATSSNGTRGSDGKIILRMYISLCIIISRHRWHTARFCHLYTCGGIISRLLLSAVSLGVCVLLEKVKKEKSYSSPVRWPHGLHGQQLWHHDSQYKHGAQLPTQPTL